MEFGVLGPIVVRARGAEVRLGGAKRRALVARLLVDANHPVPIDRLLDVWHERGDDLNPTTLASHISQLRKTALGHRIITGAGSYRIVVETGELDATCFRTEIDAARHAMAASDTSATLQRSTAALALWRSDPFQDAHGAMWAINEIARLGELRAEATELQLDALLALGDHARAVVVAKTAVAAWPLHERFWAQLMLAQYRNGRQADALRSFQELNDALAEAGLEPSAELRELDRAVCTQDRTLLIDAPARMQLPARVPAAPHERTETAGTEQPTRRGDDSRANDSNSNSAVAPPGGDGERRQLTVVSCEILDEAGLATALDPEEYRALLRAYRRVTGELITAADGTVLHHTAGTLLAYFGYPRAREDDVRRAARCALELADAINTIHTAEGLPLLARVGVATGVVVVGPTADGSSAFGASPSVDDRLIDVIGPTPTVAAALRVAADAGSVLVSDTTARLLEGWADCAPRRDIAMEGASRPINAHLLLSTTTDGGRFEASALRGLFPLVGRHDELELLATRWRRAAGHEPAVVVVTGEAGVGKTRLVRSFLDDTEARRGAQLSLRCSPDHTTTPLAPIAHHLEAAGTEALDALANTADDHDARDLVDEFLGTNTGPVTTAPHRRLARLLEVFRTWIASLVADEPGIVVFDDVQWADATTLDLLTMLVDSEPVPGLVVLVIARPEFAMPWLRHSYVTQLVVNRLSDHETRELIAGVARGRSLSNTAARHLAAQSDGVPLHVEELTRWALDVHQGAIDNTGIPATLHDSLMARLDSLGSARAIAQQAAVLGRDIDVPLLAAATGGDTEAMCRSLDDLVDAGVLQRRNRRDAPAYRFRHALIQDAAYESLLLADRRELHRAVARELAATRDDIAHTEPEVLARHFEGAGEVSDAVRFWRRAARRAEARSALTESIAALYRALRLVRDAPISAQAQTDEMRILFQLAPLLHRRDGAGDDAFGKATERALVLAERVGGPAERARAMSMSWGRATALGDLGQLEQAATELRHCAEELSDPHLLVLAHQYLASVALYQGDVAAAEAAAYRALEVYDPTFHRVYAAIGSFDPGIAARGELAWCRWHRGHIDEAWDIACSATADIPEPVQPFMVGFAAVNLGVFAWLRRDPETTRTASTRALALAHEHEIDLLAIMAQWTLAWAVGALGAPEDALGIVTEAQAGAERIGFRAHARGHLVHADVLRRLGDGPGALRALRAGQDIATTTGERREAPELWRVEAELRAEARDSDAAQACAHEAVAMARASQSKMFELRARLTLLRIAGPNDAGRKNRDELVRLYDELTEGRDTPDLIDATAALSPG